MRLHQGFVYERAWKPGLVTDPQQSQHLRGRGGGLTTGLKPAWPTGATQQDPTHHKQKLHRKKKERERESSDIWEHT